MSTVLFGWELGGGFGHVRPLLAVADGLAARGHVPVFALRKIAESWAGLRASGYAVHQAPFRSTPVRSGRAVTRSYADILTLAGWEFPDGLESVVRAWEALVELVKPALVVTDSAPSLLLAARGAVPAVQTGAGFGVPPSHLPAFPVLNDKGEALAKDETLLESVREVQRRRGRPAPPALPAVFDAPSFVTGFAEFDPYRAERPSLGPMEPVFAPMPPPAEPRWFAYLAAEWAESEEVLAGLAKTGIPGDAYVRGWSPEQRDRARRAGIPVIDRTIPLPRILERASVIVHHSGTGLGSAALAAGRPQLLFPRWLEQGIPSKRLAKMKVALSPKPEECGEALKKLVEDAAFAAAARGAAERIRDGGPWKAAETVVAACLEALR